MNTMQTETGVTMDQSALLAQIKQETVKAQAIGASMSGELAVKSRLSTNGIAPQALPTQLGPFDANSITFNNGVPVGGNAHLTLFSNGNFHFSGHFHDSGAVGYNDELAWVIVDAAGVAYTFKHSGHMGGTFTSGSRDDNWDQSGNNAAVAHGWANLCRSYHWRWQANVNWDVASTLDSLVSAIKAAGTVITTIVAVV